MHPFFFGVIHRFVLSAMQWCDAMVRCNGAMQYKDLSHTCCHALMMYLCAMWFWRQFQECKDSWTPRAMECAHHMCHGKSKLWTSGLLAYLCLAVCICLHSHMHMSPLMSTSRCLHMSTPISTCLHPSPHLSREHRCLDLSPSRPTLSSPVLKTCPFR